MRSQVSMSENGAPIENQVVYQMAKHMKETTDRIEKKLDLNTEKTERILVEIGTSTQRINALEGFSHDTKRAIENLITSAEVNKDDIIKIKIETRGKTQSMRLAMGIVTFFLVGFALMLEQSIKDYNKTVIQQEIKQSELPVTTTTSGH